MSEYRYKTSWSDNHLMLLSNINNHKIVKNEDSKYIWYHKINNEVWELHSIWVFDNYRKPVSYLHFWLALWTKEFEYRQKELSINRSATKKKVRALKKALNKSKRDKIRELNELKPEFTQQELANELEVSLSTVKRALRA